MVGESLKFPDGLRQELIEHARVGNPDEVCGILAGRGGEILRVFRVRNAASEVGPDQRVFRDGQTGAATGGRPRVHYFMEPKDQLRVYNEIDEQGLDVVGYYHSHTHTEARPSPTDIRLATDLSTVYVLVSLTEQPSVRAWRITKDDPMAETGSVSELSLSA